MIQIILCLLTGILVGFLLRQHSLKWVSKWVSALVYMLLFLLGNEIGHNPQVMPRFSSIGAVAALLAFSSVLGSALFAWLLWRFVLHGHAPKGEDNHSGIEHQKSSLKSALVGSLTLVGVFILGIVLPLPSFHYSLYALYVLMFFVGMGIGNDRQTHRSIRRLNPRFFLLPLATAAGTFAAVIVASQLTDLRASEALAVGSGFAYYSLSSILITQLDGPFLGSVALVANVMREIITLLASPLLVRWFGPLAPIASGGATTMDTTLPVILKCSGKEYAVVSIFHAMVLDFSVPFLVTFFSSMA